MSSSRGLVSAGSLGACTLLVLTTLSGAVPSIMGKKIEVIFYLCVSEAVPSIFHCRGGCFLLSGTVFPIMSVYIATQCTCGLHPLIPVCDVSPVMSRCCCFLSDQLQSAASAHTSDQMVNEV